MDAILKAARANLVKQTEIELACYEVAKDLLWRQDAKLSAAQQALVDFDIKHIEPAPCVEHARIAEQHRSAQ